MEKFSNATFFRQIALQNLQRKNLGFSETETTSHWIEEKLNLDFEIFYVDPILDRGGGEAKLLLSWFFLIQLRNCQVKEAETLWLLVLTYNTPFQVVFDHLGP